MELKLVAPWFDDRLAGTDEYRDSWRKEVEIVLEEKESVYLLSLLPNLKVINLKTV